MLPNTNTNEFWCSNQSDQTVLPNPSMSNSNDDNLLCLSWKDFRENFEQCLRDSQSVDNIPDVTLVAEDGKTFPAQKAVLAASSSFFAGILKDNPAPEVVILIRGVDSGVLKSLLDFIHVGEASIKKDQMNQFLETMEEFKLRGLKAESPFFKEETEEIASETLNLVEKQNQDSKQMKTCTKIILPKTEKKSAQVQSISKSVDEMVVKVDHGMKYSLPNRNTTDYSEWDDQILTVLQRKIGKKLHWTCLVFLFHFS